MMARSLVPSTSRGSIVCAVLVPAVDAEVVPIPQDMIRTITDPVDEWLTVAIEFRDASGRRWKRDHLGLLIRLGDAVPALRTP
jgi:hypothetical protein